MTGAAKNTQQRCSELRASIRQVITEKLRELFSSKFSSPCYISYLHNSEEATKDPKAKMQWVHYWRNIVQRYLVICDGWPDEIPFDNLSKASSGVTNLEMLLRKWKSGDIYWRSLETEEFQQLLEERNEKLGSGEIVEHTRRTRSDKGKKRRRARSPDENVSSRPRKKTYKSPATIESESEHEVDTTPQTTPQTTPRNTTPHNTTPRNTIPPTQSCDTAPTSTATGPFPSSSGSADFDLFFQFTPPSDFDSTLATTLGLLGPAPAPFDCDF